MPANRWPARHKAVCEADGDEWDRLHDAYAADFKAAYVTEFVSFAVPRGWTEKNAREWAEEIAAEALVGDHPDDPIAAARQDVPICEQESANAC